MIYKQFLQSPKLATLIGLITFNLSAKKDIQTFVNDYINLRTAKGYGLDVIGAKVGVPRVISSTIFDDKEKFGFKGQNLGNFFRSNFARLSKTGNYTMNDDQYRFVLRMAHYLIATPCTIPGVNSFYKTFYPNTVIEEALMSVTVTFYDTVSTVEGILLARRDLIPIPLGVEVKYVFKNDLFK